MHKGRLFSLITLGLAGSGCGGSPPFEPPPAEFSALRIVTATDGPEPDEDGYAIKVSSTEFGIGINDSILLTDLGAGLFNVEVLGEDSNCKFSGPRTRSVNLVLTDTVRVVFSFNCKATLRDKILFISDRDGQRDIYVINPDGTGLRRFLDWPSSENRPNVSPDRTQIAFSSNREALSGSAAPDIWTIEADGSNPINLTQTPTRSESTPSWSPDGTRIVYQTNIVSSTNEIYLMNSNGMNKTRLTVNSTPDEMPTWSPDGDMIAFNRLREAGDGLDLYIMDADGTNERFIASDMFSADWSPDGGFLVVSGTTIPSLSNEIFLIRLDDLTVTDISNAQGVDWFPKWSPDGSRITFTALRLPALAFDVFVMNADGTNQQRITTFDGFDTASDWSSP